jgi:hypothetical protein
MYKKFFCLAILLLGFSIFAQAAAARAFNVSGKVAYHDLNGIQGPGVNDNLVGIPGAVIYFVPAGIQGPLAPPSAISDSNGDYSITLEATDEEGFYYDAACYAEGYSFDPVVVYEEDTRDLFFIAL